MLRAAVFALAIVSALVLLSWTTGNTRIHTEKQFDRPFAATVRG